MLNEVKFISTLFMDSILLFLFGMYFWIEYYKESHIILAKPILFLESIAVYIHALYRFNILISENIPTSLFYIQFYFRKAL